MPDELGIEYSEFRADFGGHDGIPAYKDILFVKAALEYEDGLIEFYCPVWVEEPRMINDAKRVCKDRVLHLKEAMDEKEKLRQAERSAKMASSIVEDSAQDEVCIELWNILQVAKSETIKEIKSANLDSKRVNDLLYLTSRTGQYYRIHAESPASTWEPKTND